MPKFFKQNLLASEPILPKPEELLPEHTASTQNQTHHQYVDEEDDDYMVRDLLSWTAAARPYRKKDRSYFTTAVILVVLISLIAILIGTPLLAGALIALLFVVFALDIVPPEDIEHKITTQGITISNHFYHWYDLDSFWLGEKDNSKILYVRTHFRFPSMLMLVLGPVSEDQIKKICARFLPFQEIAPKSIIDDWAHSLQKHFPLETPHH